MIDIDFKIYVDADRALKGLSRAVGHLAEGLRAAAMRKAERDVRTARWLADGRERHKAVKRARDIRRRCRALEMKRRGWK